MKSSDAFKVNRKLRQLKGCVGYENVKSTNYLMSLARFKWVYKYMDLETAIRCLTSGTLRFAEPTQWSDKYESRFYNADYSNVCKSRDCTPRLYACCFTHKKASEAAWKTYSYNKAGLGCRCVQFKINLKRLRLGLDSFATANGFQVCESLMCYDLTDKRIESLHEKKSSLYGEFFKGFSLESYLSLLSLKRQAFDYEEEIRYFLIPKNLDSEVNAETFVKIEWKKIVEEILVDSKMSYVEKEILTLYCEKAGLNISQNGGNGIKIRPVKLYEAPTGQVKIE